MCKCSDKGSCMRDLELFQALSDEERLNVVQLARPKTYQKGETIFMEGDEADTIYLIKSGRVLLYKVSREGKEMALDILQENDFFGENTIFDNVQYTMNAKALETTLVCTCVRSDLPELLKNPVIALKIIKFLGDKINNYTEQVAALAFQDVKSRVLNTIIRLAREYGVETAKGLKINIPLNHQDLANLVNASRVMVTNTVNELKKEGVLGVDQRIFYVLNRELLEKENIYA